jgi:small neutral amino acid transporter SnatA (MarC family)
VSIKSNEAASVDLVSSGPGKNLTGAHVPTATVNGKLCAITSSSADRHQKPCCFPAMPRSLAFPATVGTGAMTVDISYLQQHFTLAYSYFLFTLSLTLKYIFSSIFYGLTHYGP